jgi:PAS domain S-box-containing protein
VIFRVPASLRVTVPLVVLAFAATLSAVNLLYHVPRAEHIAEEETRKRFAQEMSRLQSTLEYLLLKGDETIAQHEIAVLAHNHDYVFVALTDDKYEVIATTRRAWLGQPILQAVPEFDPHEAAEAIRVRRARMTVDTVNNTLVGYAAILMRSPREELRPSRSGILFLTYDLYRPKSEARAQVVQQSLYWAGWVTTLALAMWLVFHFLLTRRTAQLVHAAEQLAAGNLSARSELRGHDELARLSRAFDTMAAEVAQTQTRLREDIAERARVQQALADSEEQYRAIFNASIDGMVLWNAQARIVDVNPALWKIFGYEREEFWKLPPSKFLDSADYSELIGLVAAGAPLHTEFSGIRKDGSTVEIEVHAIPMQYQGKPHVLTIGRDVTDKKRSAEELARQRDAFYQREKLAALGSLLAGVAHELNNPLSVVVARAVLLEEQGDSTTRTSAARIRTAAERCARIVRTFLAMARQQSPQRGPVAINEVISAALDIAGYSVRTSSIEVDLDLGTDIPQILADADQLHQVLLNLIINAQQALQDQPGSRRIRLTSRFDSLAGVIRIVVADNGPGIPAHVRSRVFDPYFTTKAVGMGTGVGLAVSLGIVEAHGGTLAVECPPGAGTQFTIVLPAVRVATSQREALPSPQTSTSRLVILVVDDEAAVRETLTDILESAGHRVVLAASGREALERLNAKRYDVIMTDIRMPDVDGRTLYREIQQRWPEQATRVAFVTGDTLSSSLHEFADKCGCPVIEKPFLPSEVRLVVATIAAGENQA